MNSFYWFITFIFNPIIYGNEFEYINNENLLYENARFPNKVLILSITFYSVIASKIITITLGKSES